MKEPTVHPEVVLGFPAKHADRVTSATAIITAMTGNANFTGAAAQVTAAQGAVAAFAAAVTQAKNKVPGAVKVRGDAQIAMMKALAPLVTIVQSTVDAHLEQAATLATSAAMKLRKTPTRNKAVFAVKDGPGTGQVHLIAKAVLKALLYFWEVSSDQKTWSVASDTSAANAILGGLTVGQTYYFRFRARTRKATTDYSQVLSHVVR
jgi:hypothetical protein